MLGAAGRETRVTRRRLDAELVRRGLVPTKDEARAAVERGVVHVAGRRADKATTLVDDALPVEIVADDEGRYVSRGGEKLDAALDAFAVDVAGRRCLDAGASTGGFTDCLLRRGAAHVVAVDVGYGQLAWSLRTDERVTFLERTNVRELTPAFLPYAPDMVVADLSFISLRSTVPALAAVADTRADFVLLVKPQFEAERSDVPGGVVRDPAVWRRAIEGVAEACRVENLEPTSVIASPLTGPAGNVEFFVHAVADGTQPVPEQFDVKSAVQAGRRLAEVQ
jgi:23S rRNA (cytidine1920-2'-O)/16S rRNA (cytidine1409-2'-O)-methyltransferase